MKSIKMNILWSCIIFSFLSDVKTILVPVLRRFNESEIENPSYQTCMFKENLIVPHLLPSSPEDICSVIYDSNLIIVTGQQYYHYQIEGVPEVSWKYKSDKYYTLIVLGAFQEEIRYPSTTAPVLRNLSNILTPPERWWHQWVVVDIRKNNLEAGNIIQPYLRSTIAEPNSTHRIIHAFAVYEQSKKLELKIQNEENASKLILQQYFTPISNFEQSFNHSHLIAGNFYHVVHKPRGLVLDTSVVRIIKTGFF